MGLEQGITSEELDKNTPNTPDIAGERPSKPKDDFRSTIMSGRDNGRVIFILECGRSEVNQPNFSIKQDFSLSSLSVLGG